MRRSKWLVVLAGAAIVASASWWTRSRSMARHTTVVSTRIDSRLSEPEIRERDIAFFERRVKEDTLSATDRSQLAALYMDRARSTGGFADYGRAEQLARRSLTLRTAHNSQTFGLLAAALLARHDFSQALIVAKTVDSLDPGIAGHVALLGEIELEMGDYAAANAHFESIHFDDDQFTIAARVARWRELTGHADAARRLLRLAVSKVKHRDDLPAEQVAWFYYRLGELELRTGNLDSAGAAYRRGLAIFPDDYRILGGLARLAAARGDWKNVIDYGNQAIAIQLDPATLGTISVAYAQLGDTSQASQYARAMATSALKQPGPIHRAWGLFLLDHGTKSDVDVVLAKTRMEMRTRHDVYGYDLLAWALHKQGQNAAARDAMEHALAQHTEDAQLFYHADVIEKSLAR
jgi:tetratricopeptide (TPR) repeat protein